MVDQVDGLHEIIFDEEGKERPPWKFCNSITIARSEVVFFLLVFGIFSVILLAGLRICLFELSPTEEKFWIGCFCTCIGVLFPNPKRQ